MLRLKGKVAVITGATSGQGEAAALLFASEGAKVAVVGRNEKRGQEVVNSIKKKKGEAFFIKADVSDELSVKNMINSVIKKWKRIDILYNNAGILLNKTVTETTEQELDNIMSVNFKGVFLCCKHVIPLMKGGSIINTASIAGLVGNPNLAAYTSSKGAVIALTRQLAIDYAQGNIRVNCICPGAVWTPMVTGFLKFAPLKLVAKNMIKKSVPLKRFGQPGEIAQLALFLASDESSYMTGSIITIDGGLTAQ